MTNERGIGREQNGREFIGVEVDLLSVSPLRERPAEIQLKETFAKDSDVEGRAGALSPPPNLVREHHSPLSSQRLIVLRQES